MYSLTISYSAKECAVLIHDRPWWVQLVVSSSDVICKLTRGRFCHLHAWTWDWADKKDTRAIPITVTREVADDISHKLGWSSIDEDS